MGSVPCRDAAKRPTSGAARPPSAEPTGIRSSPMPAKDEERTCVECGDPITATQTFLEVAARDGRQQYVHTLCFNETTFDPGRYMRSSIPDTDE